MINLALLAAWILTGATLSVILARPSEPRWASAPMAAVFGPLWLPIALEQRSDDLALATAPAADDGKPPVARVVLSAPRIEMAHAGSAR